MMCRIFRSLGFLAMISLLMALLSFHVGAQDLTFWSFHDNSTPTGQAFEDVIHAFEAQNPDIDNEFVVVGGRYGEYHDKLRVAIAASSAPDLAFFERSYIGDWVATQRPFMALDDVLDASNNMSRFLPGTAGEVIHHGQVWGIPLSTALRGLLWNETLLNSAGLDFENGPQTIEDMSTFSTRLTQEDGSGNYRQFGYAPWINGFNAPGFMWAFGGEMYDADGYPSLNAAENVEAFRWIREFAQRYPPANVTAFLQANGGNSTGAFASEKLAMYAQSSNVLSQLRNMNPDITLNVGVHPFPEGGQNGGWMGGFSFVVPGTAEMTPELRRLVNFVAGAEAQRIFWARSGAPPTRADALSSVAGDIRTAEPLMAKFLEQADTQQGRPPFWGQIISFTNGAQAKVISMEATPEAALDEAQQGFVAYLKGAGVLE